MNSEYILETVVPYWHVDRDQTALLRGVFGFLQEAAIKHADLFDAGTKAMSRGESWVLHRIAADIRRYPRYEEALRVVTWSNGIHGFRGYREFRAYCGEEPVVSASSLWLYVNLGTKMLTRVPAELAARFPVGRGDVSHPDFDKAKREPAAEGAPAHTVSVRYSDVDGNGHVNNTAYFDYLQTALVRGGLDPRPRHLDVQFVKEISPGTTVVNVRLETRGQEVAFGLAGPNGDFARGTAGG